MGYVSLSHLPLACRGLPSHCVLTWPSFMACICLVSLPLLTRIRVILDQSPEFMTSLTLHTSLKALSSNTLVLTFGFWEGTIQGFPSGSVGKESAYNAGDLGFIPGQRRSSGEGNGYLHQYCCLENSMDRRAWRATVRGAAKSWTRLSD